MLKQHARAVSLLAFLIRLGLRVAASPHMPIAIASTVIRSLNAGSWAVADVEQAE